MSYTNEIRTLLLNVSASLADPLAVAEEHVPASFRARTLSPGLLRVRARLFGALPDRAMLNVRLAQYAAVIAASELSGELTAADPRVTHLPPGAGREALDRYLAGPAAAQTAGAPGECAVDGYAGFLSPGKLDWSWRLAVGGGDTATVEYVDEAGVSRSVTSGFTPSNGLGAAALPPGPLTARFTNAPGLAWKITALARPSPGLAALAASLAPGRDEEAALFPAGEEALLARFRGHPEPLERLAALLVALARRTKEAA